MMLLNSVAEVRLKEKQEYIKVAQQQTDSNKTTLKDQKRSIEEDNPEKPEPQNVENVNESSVTEKSITETGSEEAGNIRVLLMTTDYQSYFHPQVTALRDGKEIICDFESMSVSEEPMVIPAHKNGIQLTSLERQCGNPVYQGTIEIQRTDQGFTVINELPLETYLEAVVPSEMPSTYQKEALKAQAVCARTYAWKQMQEGRLSKYGADVDDSVNFQVYQNISPQQKTSEAVRETEGKILCQNGEPVQAYYFSTSSGATSTDEIWGAEEPAPYLKSVDCRFDAEEPWSRWETEILWETLESRAREIQGDSGKLLGVSVSRVNQSGAVTGLQINTETGDFLVETEYEIRQFLSPEGSMITEKDGTQVQGGKLLPSAYFEISAKPGESVILTGGGYGHGVGMSQTGADQMAEQGYTCQEILEYFFKNIEILQIGS
ncbi:SpoIID/LytB domain-containing protein [Blautia sp. XA-2221]|uniref:SpoIID/LytB domain-containing protein n=1 Tax=Blautia sp. XA-2221 TaxID=2903961 RepID=UPI002379C9E6|nr:SpoIID/LytB domain-containing protein [Blautia sp. XA-2221]